MIGSFLKMRYNPLASRFHRFPVRVRISDLVVNPACCGTLPVELSGNM
jgi:hypothetical protein